MKLASLIAGLALAASIVVPASAVTFDFRPGGNAGGVDFNLPSPVPGAPLVVDGIGIQANGGTYDGTTIIDPAARRVTRNANGLGVDCNGLFGPSILCPNEIDGNAGRTAEDLLTLVFDQEVFFDEVLFTEVDGDDDVDIYIDGVAIAALTDLNILGATNPVGLLGLSGTSISFGAFDASFNNLNEDDFRVGSITVTAVPVPAGLPLLLSALAAFAFIGRRSRT